MNDPRRPIYHLLLAHHPRSAAHRCLWLPLGPFRIALCARCLGLYPTLALVLTLELVFDFSRSVGLVDWIAVLSLSAPALVDWGAGHLGWRGHNSLRLLTGVLLGVGLGRSLYVYLFDPWSELLWVHLTLLVVGAFAFEVVRRFDLSDY